MAFPKGQIPAGPTQVYRFRAAFQGEAQVEIPHRVPVNISSWAQAQSQLPSRDPNLTFAVRIRVYEQRKP